MSTDLKEQVTSYQAQKKYYTDYIQNNPDWEFAGMYTDEGISATSTRHREGFNQMIQDALDGKIDLIITKSVSRFARNTVDSLSTIRKLKENNVECYFEKENIWTFQSSGELQSELDDYIATHTDGFTEEYRAKYERYQELLEMHEQQEAERESAQARYTQIQEITKTLKRGALTEFDESVWNTVIEYVTVNHNGSMMFRFRDGTEITE